jgi:hypothetical protein
MHPIFAREIVPIGGRCEIVPVSTLGCRLLTGRRVHYAWHSPGSSANRTVARNDPLITITQ